MEQDIMTAREIKSALKCGDYKVLWKSECGCYITVGPDRDGKVVIDVNRDSCWAGKVLCVGGLEIARKPQFNPVTCLIDDVDEDDDLLLEISSIIDTDDTTENNEAHSTAVRDAVERYIAQIREDGGDVYSAPDRYRGKYDIILVVGERDDIPDNWEIILTNDEVVEDIINRKAAYVLAADEAI